MTQSGRLAEQVRAFAAEELGGIYVVDPETDEVVFANAKILGGDPGRVLGQKCYRALMGRSAPCTLCPRGSLRRGEVCRWEYYDERRGRYFTVRSALVEDGGRLYQLGAAADVTEQMSLSNAAIGYLALMGNISELQRVLAQSPERLFAVALPILARQFGARYVAFLRHAPERGASAFFFDRERGEYREGEFVFSGFPDCEAAARSAFLRQFAGARNERIIVRPFDVCGEPYGLLLMEPELYEENEDKNTVLGVLRTCVENTAIRTRIDWESAHDAMTGLLNRNQYISRIEASHVPAGPVGLVNADVDNLKSINDNLGHAAGDAAIRRTAQALAEAAGDRPGILLYRMGGDEFLAVLDPCAQEDTAAFCDRFERALRALNKTGGGDPVHVSVGSCFSAGGQAMEELYRESDRRMYETKRGRHKKI